MSGSGKSNMHTYGAAQVELFLFYQTNDLLKTWFLSSWGLCEESLGCCWHCQAQGFQPRGRQLNYCKTRKRTNCLLWCSIHKVHKIKFLDKSTKGGTSTLWMLFSPFSPCFFLSILKCDFLRLRALSLQVFSRKISFFLKYIFLIFHTISN